MKKKTWDRYAPIYERFMRSDRKMYEYMYDRIPLMIEGKRVLEIATGPGLLASHVAYAAKEMIATDYSEGMIRQAQMLPPQDNLRFEVADATELPYEDHSFDVVIISNALHVMPEPEKALAEIRRVLTQNGILIAPNFVHGKKNLLGEAKTKLLQLAGISFEHQWGPRQYKVFLEQNGWILEDLKILKAATPIMYTECRRAVTFSRAEASDTDDVIAFYEEMVDRQEEREYSPDWTKGVYPTAEDIASDIGAGEMYIGRIDGKIACATVLSGNDPIYKNVNWQTEYADEEVGVIHLFGVLPEYCGMGLGSRLIQYSAGVFRQQGRKVIRLDVLKGNAGAEKLYQKNGFHFVTEAPVFYEDTGLTDYEMYEREL